MAPHYRGNEAILISFVWMSHWRLLSNTLCSVYFKKLFPNHAKKVKACVAIIREQIIFIRYLFHQLAIAIF